MYESRDFAAMPILADAMQDAGATTPTSSATAAARDRTCGGAGWWTCYSGGADE
jgi:hypothetical protein